MQLHNASTGFLMVDINGASTYVGPQSWVTIPLGGQTTSMRLTLLDASVGTVYATVFMATDGNLPNTLVSGSLNQQQVTVEGGTVTISGTPTVDFASGATVAISGTPTVDLASGASVSISGTPNIVIQSGSVNISGGQLTNSLGIALQPTADQLVASDLGDGSAGAVSFGADSTLTADLQTTSITVPSGITVGTGGYRVRCQGTCLVDGAFDNSATNSTSSEVGAPGATGTIAGGAAGKSATDDQVYGVAPPSASLEGGSGASAYNIGGGTASPSIASPTISLLHTGTLSGGGSGGAYSNSTGTTSNSGSGGGVVLILCSEITGGGTLSANGGAAETGDTANGGAGGGGGGVVIVACYTNSFTGTLNVGGGSSDNSPEASGDSGTAMIMVAS